MLKKIIISLILLIVIFIIGCGPIEVPFCGNNLCEFGEQKTCPKDCGITPKSKCRDSDGGSSYLEEGYAELNERHYDYCRSETQLVEYWCGRDDIIRDENYFILTAQGRDAIFQLKKIDTANLELEIKNDKTEDVDTIPYRKDGTFDFYIKGEQHTGRIIGAEGIKFNEEFIIGEKVPCKDGCRNGACQKAIPEGNTVELHPSGVNNLKLKLVTKDGIISEEIFYVAGDKIALGKNSNRPLHVREGDVVKDEGFFVAEGGKHSFLLQLKKIDTVNNEIEIRDTATGDTDTISYSQGTGILYKEGYKFTFKGINRDGMTLSDIAADPWDTIADLWTKDEHKVGIYTDGIIGIIKITKDSDKIYIKSGIVIGKATVISVPADGMEYREDAVTESGTEISFSDLGDQKGVKLTLAQTSDPVGCTDSDNGVDIYIQGTTTIGNEIKSDECISPNEVEDHYCDIDFGQEAIHSRIENCPNGCSNGECIRGNVEDEDCIDSDGGKNYFEEGFTEGPNNRPEAIWGYKKEDGCDGSNLLEWFCIEGKKDVEMYRCPNSCQDGACIGEAVEGKCTDSDGGMDYYEKGTLELKNENSRSHLSDRCTGIGEGIEEFICGSDGCGYSIVYPTKERKNPQYMLVYNNGNCNLATTKSGYTYDCSIEGKICQDGACIGLE